MDIIEHLKEYFNKDKNVCFSLLFGSYAGDRQRKSSDLDIAVYFYNPPKEVKILDYINNISNYAGKEIDLVILNKASPFIRHEIMKNKKAIVIKNRDIYRTFREETITDYQRYKYLSGLDQYD